MKIVADLACLSDGTEPRFVDLLREMANSPDDTYLIIRRSQDSSLLRLSELSLHIKVLDDTASQMALTREVSNLATEVASDGAPVRILTLSSTVLGLRDWQADALPSQVEIARWVPRTASPSPTSGWPDGFVPLEEAVDLLVRALGAADAANETTALYMTEIRKRLAAIDNRFLKTSSEAARTPKLMGMIINRARERGLIRVVGAPPNPRIYLASSKIPSPSKASPSITSGGRGIDQMIDRSDGRVTSDAVLEKLRDLRLGPFSDVRVLTYDELDKVVASDRGRPLLRAIDDAVENCREKVTRDGIIPPERLAKFPWRFLKRLIEELARRRPVALDENGSMFSPAWADGERPVHSLRSDWQYELDGALLLAVWDAGLHFAAADVDELAGALYMDRSIENIVRMGRVVNALVGSGDLQWDRPDLGTLVRRRPE